MNKRQAKKKYKKKQQAEENFARLCCELLDKNIANSIIIDTETKQVFVQKN